MLEESTNKYWVIVASKDHVAKGAEAGIVQANHGKEAPLKRMHKGDYVLFYSGKKTFAGHEKCQAFTAIAQVKDKEVFQYRMSEDFWPYRRKADYLKCKEVGIHPLIEQLAFITDKKHWGFPFRFGFFEISKHDFERIAQLMLKPTDARKD